MINLTFTVDNVNTVRQIYDRIRVQRADNSIGPFTSLIDLVPEEIELRPNQSVYNAIDYLGETDNWYRSQYYSTVNSGISSSWSSPVLGEEGELYYDPLFPPEVSYGSEDKLIINRLRLLIGDPVGLRREYGEDVLSSVHTDLRTYELDEKGWPCDIHVAGQARNSSEDPTINGYRYLRFGEDITPTTWVTVSGSSNVIEVGIDIWYYTFRYSDRELVEAYDNCPPPGGLSFVTANQEAYLLATAIDLLTGELWLDSTESGAKIGDEKSTYDPSSGLETRRKLLDNLRKKLDDLINRLLLGGVTGVRID
jgi:hypothetical protein